jgi:putative spermidine/putrescine transport system ATP-binding protein
VAIASHFTQPALIGEMVQKSSNARGGSALQLLGINHSYSGARVLAGISLKVDPGELLILLGPSGCGKTTLLRIIAGLVAPTTGRIIVANEDVTALAPEDRTIGIVFQSYALFPHMTVAENIAYGLEARRLPRSRIKERVAAMLDAVRLNAFDQRYPRQLSGGQQQRAALARALAIQPRLLLLDEPFGALDKNLRREMQAEVRRIQRAFSITTVMVTHDQEEAMSMADRIAVMNQGEVVQSGTSAEIYDRPADTFVANFIGMMNMLPGRIADSGANGRCRVVLGESYSFDCMSVGPHSGPGAVRLGIRPENLSLGAPSEEGIRGRLTQIVPLGPVTQLFVELSDGSSIVLARAGHISELTVRLDDVVSVRAKPDAVCSVFAP